MFLGEGSRTLGLLAAWTASCSSLCSRHPRSLFNQLPRSHPLIFQYVGQRGWEWVRGGTHPWGTRDQVVPLFDQFFKCHCILACSLLHSQNNVALENDSFRTSYCIVWWEGRGYRKSASVIAALMPVVVLAVTTLLPNSTGRLWRQGVMSSCRFWYCQECSHPTAPWAILFLGEEFHTAPLRAPTPSCGLNKEDRGGDLITNTHLSSVHL